MKMEEMSPYERVMGVLNGQPVDRVPVAPIIRHWCARQAGFTFSEVMKSASRWAYCQYYSARTFGMDVLWDLFGIHAEAEAMGSVLNIPDDMACSVKIPAIGDYERDLPNLKLLNPYKDGRLPMVLEGIRQLNDLSGGYYPVLGYCQGPFRMASMLRGTEPLLKDCMKSNKHLEEFLDICTNALIVYGSAVIQAGADFLWIGDPSSSGDVISSKIWMKYGFPYTVRLVKALKHNGMKIMLHICGKTHDRLESYVQTGIDAFSGDEAVDLAFAREKMGNDICLWGNVSPTKTMFAGTPEQVESEAMACIEKARGKKGNFILGSGCIVPPETQPANVLALTGAARKYGPYK
jgi:uroporphyrinogen decarboxylase